MFIQRHQRDFLGVAFYTLMGIVLGLAFLTTVHPTFHLPHTSEILASRDQTFLPEGTWITYNSENSGLPSNRITDIAFGDDGKVWVATPRGLSILHEGDWTTLTRDNTNGGLPSDLVWTVAVAEDGQVWAGTSPFSEGGTVYGGGIGVLDPETSCWATYNEDNTGPTGLQSNWIGKIAIDPAGRVWIGVGSPPPYWGAATIGYGLTLYDHGTWTTYTRNNSGLVSDMISDIAFDRQNRIWIANHWHYSPFLTDDGVSRMDLGENDVPDPPGEGDDMWTSWTIGNSGLETMMGLQTIHVDRADAVWNGGWTCTNTPLCENLNAERRLGVHASLNRFVGPLWMAHEPFLETGLLSSIASDANNSLWVGTLWGGAWYLSDEGRQPITTSEYPLASDEITVVRVDPRGDVWFGTADAGISRYSQTTPVPTATFTPTVPATYTATPTSTEDRLMLPLVITPS